MTWLPPKRDDAAAKADFIAVYGEEGEAILKKLEGLSKPKPPTNDRPALQTEGSDDPMWWNK